MKSIKELSVKGIKTFRGHEGNGFNATLYLNGKKVAFVMDDANGGMYSYECISSPLMQGVEEFIKTLPEEEVDLGDKRIKIKQDLDTVVSKLVEDFEVERNFKRKCKTKTLYLTNDCKKGTYISYNRPYDTAVKEMLLNRYKDSLLEIINERYI